MTAGFIARIAIVVLAGLTWAARSLQSFADPAYTDPVSLFDWFSVVSFSGAFLLTAAGLLILRENVRPAMNVSVAIAIVVVACVVAGVANLLEDGLGLRGLGTLFAIGSLTAWIGLFVIAAMLGISRDRSLAYVPLLTAIGFAFFQVGGGVITLVGWLGFARVLFRRHEAAAASAASA